VGKSIIDTSSVTRVGLDLAKRVVRIHAVDATGSVVIARSVNRRTLLKFFRRASSPRSRTSARFPAGGSSPPSLGRPRVNMRPAASRGSGGSPRWATAILTQAAGSGRVLRAWPPQRPQRRPAPQRERNARAQDIDGHDVGFGQLVNPENSTYGPPRLQGACRDRD